MTGKRSKRISDAGGKRKSQEGEASAFQTPSLPRWAPYALFAVLTLVVFREFIVSNGLIFGSDVLELGYYARHWYAEVVRAAHVFPLWNPYLFGGLPFVDAMHGDIFYPTTLLQFIMPVHRAMGWKLVVHVFLAGIVTYGWLRHLRISAAIATWGGVAYMLAPVLISLIYPGHDGKLFVTALTPLALWVTDWAITRGATFRFATLSLIVALLIFTAHMQLAYFTTWAIVVLAAFRLVQGWRAGESRLKLGGRLGALAFAGALGALAIGAVQIWAPLRYLTQYSQRVEKTTEAEEERGYAYSTSWSLHPEEAFSLVVPEFIGGNIATEEAVTNTYWGRNQFKLNHEYGGLIPLLLLPLAFMTRRRRGEIWLFTGLAAASLIYALGATTPLFYAFYWFVPGVKLFRAPSSIMFIFAISVITAAALGLENMREDEEPRSRDVHKSKATIYLWSATGLFALLAVLAASGTFTDAWVSVLYRDITPAKMAALEANLPNIRSGLWLTVLITGLLAAAHHLRRRRSLNQLAWIGALVVLSILDLLRIDSQFIQVINPALIYPRDDTTEYLLERSAVEEPFRVFQLPGSAVYRLNHFAFHGLEQLQGHHGNELGRYRDLMARAQSPESLLRILRLLNVRYIVSGAPIQGPGLREVYRGRRSLVYELARSFPRAFLVSRIETLPDSLILDRLLSSDFDPASEMILTQEHDGESYRQVQGTVRWLERDPNGYALEVDSDQPGYLVISDNHYPAWEVEVDGINQPLLRADYTMRALQIPAGRHQVRLQFRSSLLRASMWTTGISLILALGLVGGSLAHSRRRNSEGKDTAGKGGGSK
ncbi:MAG: hypothetical protein JSU87_16745 [Gemmatimonadota bacterium]|nr:MAG: hypothetical protein JSU87_16745 [Gemmatimonadota bacterium]